MNGDGGKVMEVETEEVEEEMVVRVVRPPGTGLGISIAGGMGATPFRGDDEVSFSRNQLENNINITLITWYVLCHAGDQEENQCE